MRPTPTKNQMKARQMFLECHKNKIIYDYMLPSNDLKFDSTITEILLGEEYVGKVVFDSLNTKEGLARILSIKKDHRDKLNHQLKFTDKDYRKGWNLHLDYESIIMDKLIDLEKTPVQLLNVKSGNSFFQEQIKLKLMHQGYQLVKYEPYNEKSNWFSQWNDKWYFKHALTRHRLIDILQQYYGGWVKDFANENPPKYNTIETTFEAMKELYINKISVGKKVQKEYKSFLRKNPNLRYYSQFISQSMEYNEELRLMRSQSVFNLIQGCKKDKLHPYDIFLDILKKRKINIDKKYKVK